jgi:hypothetical protein
MEMESAGTATIVKIVTLERETEFIRSAHPEHGTGEKTHDVGPADSKRGHKPFFKSSVTPLYTRVDGNGL